MRYKEEMGSSPLFPLQLNFSTFIITFFVVFLAFPTSNGNEDDYVDWDCPLMTCGKFSNIGYPFWGDGWRPKYCGHPAFELDCKPNPPILHINPEDDPDHSSSYRVLDINSSTMTIKLYPDLGSDHCFVPSRNVTHAANANLIEYSAGVEDITLFYNCSIPDKMVEEDLATTGNLTCSDDDDVHKTARYYWEKGDHKAEAALNNIGCTSMSTLVPVLGGKDYPSRINTTLKSILENGLTLNYSDMHLELCYSCKKSGGQYGYNLMVKPKRFICLCDGWYSDSDCRKSDKLLILKIVLPVGLFILTALTVGIFWWKKRRFDSKRPLSRAMPYNHLTSDVEIGSSSFFGIPVFCYEALLEATNNFDPNRILGDGGFGIVYHGKLRDGREVAVKRLYERNYKRVGFMNEIEILTKLKHPNLVTLYGCTSRHSRELLLVYEYIPNGTVADHLHGDQSESTSLTWTVRMKIAIQTAGALSYLHASEFVHRDVKTNNILLHNDFSVKVADFGLSRLYPLDATHVTTAPQGTPGYLDPEYRKCYQVTNKSDVYSFGVVLIELISSLPAIDISRDDSEINLSAYAMNKIQQGALDELIDQKLGFESDFKVKRMVTLVAELAFQCLQQDKEIRPCMEQVLEELERIESMDYEALEEEEMIRGFQMSKPASEDAKSEVEQPTRDTQNPSSSPKSVIVSWADKSTVSDTSG